MSNEWERLNQRMVKIVEKEASVLKDKHNWIRKLVSVGGFPAKYIYSYYSNTGYISPLSTGEWKYSSKDNKITERSIDLDYLKDKYKNAS